MNDGVRLLWEEHLSVIIPPLSSLPMAAAACCRLDACSNSGTKEPIIQQKWLEVSSAATEVKAVFIRGELEKRFGLGPRSGHRKLLAVSVTSDWRTELFFWNSEGRLDQSAPFFFYYEAAEPHLQAEQWRTHGYTGANRLWSVPLIFDTAQTSDNSFKLGGGRSGSAGAWKQTHRRVCDRRH